MTTASPVDTPALEAALRSHVSGEVRFDPAGRAIYSTDASNYRHVPLGVVIPRSVDDVLATIDTCRRFGAPILNRGGGTSLSGQTCNVAVVIDMSKYLNRVLEVDPNRRFARVQPGVVLDDLRDAAERHHLTFGPDPATHSRCTLGGMIGNNSCGVHSVMAGKTDANVESLDIVTYRGLRLQVSAGRADFDQVLGRNDGAAAIYRALQALRDRYEADIRSGFPDIPRRVSGFDLPYLLEENGFNVAASLVGTEGTCVTVLEATVRLVDSPPHRTLVILGYPDVFAAADDVPRIVEFGPIGLEGFDDRLIGDMKARGLHLDDMELLPEGNGWLMVEFGGASRAESEDKAQGMVARIQKSEPKVSSFVCGTAAEARRLWVLRESGLAAAAPNRGDKGHWPGWDDSAVPPAKMGAYLRDLQKLMDRFNLTGAFYGHFGQGCLHVRYNFDLTSAIGIRVYRQFLTDAAHLVVSYGGSLSGEHGDGQAHGELLPIMYGPRLMEAFREFKGIWDPDGKMNPGKVLNPRPLDSDLRLGSAYDPPALKTNFAFPDDAGSFANATLRCVGVGKCRQHQSGVMCPSYMATREEEYSTRGRARLLFEMLRGEPLKKGWRSDGVRDALDLCLACKACKSECPAAVDMATYKAEFLSHYYRRRLRPRSAYAMGLIYWWARAAAHAPSLVNALGSSAATARVMKMVGGIARERSLPEFASKTFRSQFPRRTRPQDHPTVPSADRVILWPDTFNNHFHSDTATAATEVLESAGFAVEIPSRSLCCGRPLYDFGMLQLAKHLLRQILKTMRDDIRAGVPVIVLEPSCASVFRDELVNLFPRDEDARRLSRQTFLLSDFLETHADRVPWPVMNQTVKVQAHCHQRSVMGTRSLELVLKRLGVRFEILDSGCCGMAGAFGFERDHYDVSVACAERVLIPRLAEEASNVLVVSDGFSCREQISQLTGRPTIHLAQLIRLGQVSQAAVGSDRPTN